MSSKVPPEPHPGFRHEEEISMEKDERDVRPGAIVHAFGALGGTPNAWGRGHLKLYAACLIIYLCSTMNGTSTS
jgi:hypothetical protein